MANTHLAREGEFAVPADESQDQAVTWDATERPDDLARLLSLLFGAERNEPAPDTANGNPRVTH